METFRRVQVSLKTFLKFHWILLQSFVDENAKGFEMLGVIMRIVSFALVSWLGPKSPFLFVWIFNTTDAIILSWCAILKRDRAYTVLNVFWVLVGAVGIYRAW